MVKTITAELQLHLQQEVTTLTTIWRLTRQDGTQFFFTDHDNDIIFGGNTYLSDSGYQRTAIANNSALSVDNMDVQGIFDSAQITEEDLRAGLYDYATVEIALVNWQDLTQGELKLRRGFLGEATFTQQGVFQAELRGLTQLLSQRIGEVFQPECRADLGDTRCKVPILPDIRQNETAYTAGTFVRVATIAGSDSRVYEDRIYECITAGTTAVSAPVYNTTVGQDTTDGTAVFRAYEAWTRAALVNTVTDGKIFTLDNVVYSDSRDVDDWFNGGALTFETGSNAGRTIEIRDWVQSTRTVTLFFPASYTIAPGDVVRLYPGCDKRVTTCQNKFAIVGSIEFNIGNVRNFRGEPNLPGQDQYTSYPDAQ